MGVVNRKLLRDETNMGVEDPVEQSLANLHIDPAFILEPKHRPKRKHNDYSDSGGHVPVIDLALLQDQKSKPQALDDIVAQVSQACAEWGFFQVVNHGVSLELLEELKANAKEFFDLPLEEKRKVWPIDPRLKMTLLP